MRFIKSLSLSLCGVVASVALAPAAQAAPIQYSFNNASYSGADFATIFGSFAYDPTTNSITSSNINLAGTVAGNSVNCTNCSTGIYDPYHFAINLGPQALYITFSSSLANGATTPLSLMSPQGNQPEFQGRPAFTSVTGAAVLAAVPEPATWAMMMLGFGLMGAGLRHRKSKVAFA